MKLPPRRLMIASVVIAAVSCTPGEEPDRHKTLELSAIRTLIIPESVSVVGINAHESGAAVLWRTNVPGIAFFPASGAGARELDTVLTPIGATISQDLSAVTLVDGPTRQVFRIGLDGSAMRMSAPLLATLEVAAKGNLGWYFVGSNEDRQRVVGFMPDSGASRPLTAPLSRDTLSCPVLVIPTSDTALVACRRSPYTVYGVRTLPGQLRVREQTWPSVSASIAEDSTDALWVSVSLLPLDDGFLHTIADLRSDSRRFRTISANGVLRSEQYIQAPLGFAASVPASRLLFAVRRTTRHEVVVYEWHWGENNSF